jgi:hypothetical protein
MSCALCRPSWYCLAPDFGKSVHLIGCHHIKMMRERFLIEQPVEQISWTERNAAGGELLIHQAGESLSVDIAHLVDPILDRARTAALAHVAAIALDIRPNVLPGAAARIAFLRVFVGQLVAEAGFVVGVLGTARGRDKVAIGRAIPRVRCVALGKVLAFGFVDAHTGLHFS